VARTRRTKDSTQRRADEVVRRLAEQYPDARCALVHDDVFQLLVATILSAQCTDEMVNKVTPILFSLYPDAQAMASASIDELESVIRPTGFFHNKARSLVGMSQALVDRYASEVPGTLEELVTLPGVGRKTANVVLGVWYGVPGITVDTHVGRLSRRLCFTTQEDPEKVERELMELWPKDSWSDTSLRMILHGRQVCLARKPRCDACVLNDLCPSAFRL
jgi:endonuclease III